MLQTRLFLLLTTVVIFTTACAGLASPTADTAAPDTTEAEQAASENTEAANSDTDAAPASDTTTSDTTEAPPEGFAKNGKPLLDDEPARPYAAYWKTDFSLHTVPFSEIFSGGVPRDGIPPIDNPSFVSVADADEWLDDIEPVFALTIDGVSRGYPIQILTWHEIVNDTLNDVPVAVTFCPLCNSAVTFERTLNGTVHDFGVSGNLRNSDLIMWDRQTETWWQQLTGEGIVGELVGEQLTFVPTQLVSWANFKEAFPEADVLSRETGHNRRYGSNPYRGYDSNPRPFLFDGTPDPRLAAVDRIIAVDLNGEAVAYPYNVLAEENVVADTVGGEDVVVFWETGTTSALDAGSIAGSRDVGAATVYSPVLNGEILTFSWNGSNFVDDQTGSTWNIFGKATDGELAGQQLTAVNHANHFWFAWGAFKPETRVYSGGE
ncbi:MAG: DUF3179 domain-containing protein [Chloroflexota bacterium]